MLGERAAGADNAALSQAVIATPANRKVFDSVPFVHD